MCCCFVVVVVVDDRREAVGLNCILSSVTLTGSNIFVRDSVRGRGEREREREREREEISKKYLRNKKNSFRYCSVKRLVC